MQTFDAPAFLMTPAALGQRLSRAKARLKAEGAAFAGPEADEIAFRLSQVIEAVLAAAALGWHAVPGSDPACADLASEAVHLAEVLSGLVPNAAEPRALLAQILQKQARRGARVAGYVPLCEQHVALWDHAMIARADAHLAAAGAMGHLGRFQLGAAIPSVHAERRWTGRTNWPGLHTLHAALQRLAPSLGGRGHKRRWCWNWQGRGPVPDLLDNPKGTARFQPALGAANGGAGAHGQD